MRAAGTTTFEAKSGYGLDRDTELAQLRAVKAGGGIPTWLGAHAVPPEFENADAYLDFALAEVLPEAAKIAEAADVFLERGAFDAEQARRYLTACRDAGLALRLHGDQFTEQGAIPLAVELGARSVDHLEATGRGGIAALAASEVTGVLLPASALFLGRPMPPARELVDAGAAVALATDFNPGSAFCESLPLVCSLAATQLKLSPAEALAATTVNAAHVLGRAGRKGRIAPGYDADLVLLDAPDWRYLAYHLGHDHVAAIVVGGARLDAACQPVSRSGAARRIAATSTSTSTSTTRARRSRSTTTRRTRPRPSRPRRRPASARTRSRRSRPARPPAASSPRDARSSRPRGTGSSARGLIFAPIMLVVVYLLKPASATPASIIVQVVVLLLFFLPFSYVMDSVMYRQYRKRIGDPLPPRGSKPKG